MARRRPGCKVTVVTPPEPADTSLGLLDRDAGIVVLTGAGVSAESGLATFRDAGGIWATVRIEDVATPEAFARDPARVQAFYNARRAQLRDPSIAPNAAHLALAELDWRWPGPFLLVTQNVDDLHARAGQRRMIRMHGGLDRQRCLACGVRTACAGDLSADSRCADCGAVGRLRPDIVWFGEMPEGLVEIETALGACALFVAIGTSGQVWPAAGFVESARAAGAVTVEINLAPSEVARAFHHRRLGPATRLVPSLVAELLGAA
jgi:NAD-dependent deacetylase